MYAFVPYACVCVSVWMFGLFPPTSFLEVFNELWFFFFNDYLALIFLWFKAESIFAWTCVHVRLRLLRTYKRTWNYYITWYMILTSMYAFYCRRTHTIPPYPSPSPSHTRPHSLAQIYFCSETFFHTHNPTENGMRPLLNFLYAPQTPPNTHLNSSHSALICFLYREKYSPVSLALPSLSTFSSHSYLHFILIIGAICGRFARPNTSVCSLLYVCEVLWSLCKNDCVDSLKRRVYVSGGETWRCTCVFNLVWFARCLLNWCFSFVHLFFLFFFHSCFFF